MKKLLLLLLLSSSTMAFSQPFILPIWPEGIPCENELEMEVAMRENIGRVISKVHTPELEVFLPPAYRANGTGVVICPGGGYTVLAYDWEGVEMAKWLNTLGIAAFVLKYRLPHWETVACRDQVALMDAQRAIRTVRNKAKEWNLAEDRIGIMGFSAGGHLASTAITHFDYGDPNASLDVDKVSCRPDFAILMYAVITMDTTFTHMGSRNNLIGQNPDAANTNYFSNETQVTQDTPPTILIHADDDKAVLPENSIRFYLALRKAGVPAAMHIYQDGEHGFSFGEGRGSVVQWTEACEGWMRDRELIFR